MPTIQSGQVIFSFDKGQLDWIKNKLNKLSPRERDGAAERGFRKVTNLTEYELKRRTLSGQILNVRSGRFRTSIGAIVKRSGRDIVGIVGSGVRSGKRVPYANIHEYGGIIRPRPENKSGFLWIPIRSGSGFAVASGLTAASGRTSFSSKTAGFARVRSVTIPARRYLSRTVARISRQAVAVMLNEIDAELKKA